MIASSDAKVEELVVPLWCRCNSWRSNLKASRAIASGDSLRHRDAARNAKDLELLKSDANTPGEEPPGNQTGKSVVKWLKSVVNRHKTVNLTKLSELNRVKVEKKARLSERERCHSSRGERERCR